jgi:hypothetical protein
MVLLWVILFFILYTVTYFIISAVLVTWCDHLLKQLLCECFIDVQCSWCELRNIYPRLALGPFQLPLQGIVGVKWPELEADHSSPSVPRSRVYAASSLYSPYALWYGASSKGQLYLFTFLWWIKYYFLRCKSCMILSIRTSIIILNGVLNIVGAFEHKRWWAFVIKFLFL